MEQQGTTRTEISYLREAVVLWLGLIRNGHEVAVRNRPTGPCNPTGLQTDPLAAFIDIDADSCTTDEFLYGVAMGFHVLAEYHAIPTARTIGRLHAV